MDADLGKRSRRRALTAVSRTLSELVERDPAALRMVQEDELPPPEDYPRILREALESGGLGAFRRSKRLLLLSIAGRDASGDIELEEATAALSSLADGCVGEALAWRSGPPGLAVIAMGKLGGRELNYYSDIDLMFVTTGDIEASTKGASALLRDLGDFSPDGRAYEVDTNLRPEGRDGALVRSLDGYIEYYRRWAKPWEYQALIKARHIAGDEATGAALVRATRAVVYPEEVSSERIASIRAVKERVEEHANRSVRRSTAGDGNDVKLGPGGIRDIEFSVQLLQLVHGGSDHSVRSGNTLEALGALSDGGYMAEEDRDALRDAYRWLRTVEHRLQLWQERRIRHLPTDDRQLTRLAHGMGFVDSPSTGARESFAVHHASVLVDVRSRFDRLFYRPMIESLADGAGPRLSPEALGQRLRVLGFRDVERATRVLHDLVSGTSRRARLFRVLTPPLLRFLASAPRPDGGLFSFLLLGESLESRLDVLGALRDNPPGLEFLARVLGSGRLLGEVLAHVPDELTVIAAPRGPVALKSRDRLCHEAKASLEWRTPEQRLDGLRRFKRREMLGVALADIGGEADSNAVGEGLADLADACLDAVVGADGSFAVIGMGKLGGRELSYSSDIDVMFVAAGDPHAAERRAEQLIKAIGEVTPEGQAFRIDAALRPEGKSGPLVRSLDSFREYYERWAKPWEFQALLKARLCAGDQALGDGYLELTRSFAYPDEITAAELAEIRHLKARMERERIPRGTDPRRNFKLGPGGISDIEWAVQILQRSHGAGAPELRVTGTVAALEGAVRAGLIGESDGRLLSSSYAWLARLRNRLFFMIARPVDALPAKPEELESLGIAMGFDDQPRQELEEHYLGTTRRVRRVAERLIYG
ncbi:MAG TPA: bifunctional [glutamine synthetase] adenylyltransferase/[glutamine synthetase]-adenylyl-L-tyrosine phosphorylase [Actinomycetota bacterium]|jgi:glutamate-ammonia-ligase adenylyltransferase